MEFNLVLGTPADPDNPIVIRSGKLVHVSKEISWDAKRIADLSLHDIDLTIAQHCIESIINAHDEILITGLWTAAIVHFGKCFTPSKSRGQLPFEKIYRDELSLLAYKYIMNLRNKHVVHDENIFHQSFTAAAVMPKGEDQKIREIVSINTTAHINDSETLTNLHLLIKDARDWILAEKQILTDKLKVQLEGWDHEKLEALPSISWKEMTTDDVLTQRY